jgi:hypothetical protein
MFCTRLLSSKPGFANSDTSSVLEDSSVKSRLVSSPLSDTTTALFIKPCATTSIVLIVEYSKYLSFAILLFLNIFLTLFVLVITYKKDILN